MHIDEATLAKEIYHKLKLDSSISYSEISEKAFKAGRDKLALNVSQRQAMLRFRVF